MRHLKVVLDGPRPAAIATLLLLLSVLSTPFPLAAQLLPPAQSHVLYFPSNTIARAPLLKVIATLRER